jgi:malate dehydrogenase (oxaloacetate-decarboxylating)
MLNCGLAFSAAERAALGLTGRLPAPALTLDEQTKPAYRRLTGGAETWRRPSIWRSCPTATRPVLPAAGRVADRAAPVVYAPTVGEAIEKVLAREHDQLGRVEAPVDNVEYCALERNATRVRLMVTLSNIG